MRPEPPAGERREVVVLVPLDRDVGEHPPEDGVSAVADLPLLDPHLGLFDRR